MPEPSSEPEKYTIDEMMDRLKARDSPDKQPQLVTRPDGSQAMKVKKRRRRTNQAVNQETKRNKRVQIVQVAGFVVILILMGLAAGIGIIYANSASYRESLISKLEAASGAEVELDKFRMNPVAAHANGISLSWPAGNTLESLQMKSLAAKIAPASFTGKAFDGEEVVAISGKLLLRMPDPSDPARQAPKAEGKPQVNFYRYSVPSMDIAFGEAGSLSRAEASLYPGAVAGHAELRLRGGLLQFANWPPMNLDRSFIKVRGSEFQVQSLRFQIPEASNRRMSGGSIDFSGTLSPLSREGSHTLSAKLEMFLLPYLIGGDLGRFFLGRVDTGETANSNFLRIDPASPEPAELELTVFNSVDSRIDLTGFKFLQLLSAFFDDRWYEFPNFDDDTSMVVKRIGGRVALSDINLMARGRMAVRGSMSNAEGGKISGKLQIGIPEATINAAADDKLSKMFGEVRDGYRWVEIEISGTTGAPQDDFRSLYMANSAPEGSGGQGQADDAGEEDVPQDTFEDLIKED
jgi:hypothetical protein